MFETASAEHETGTEQMLSKGLIGMMKRRYIENGKPVEGRSYDRWGGVNDT